MESLEDICAVLGESRYVVLARELTKTWESIHGAPIGELVAWVKEDENRRKGEMVLIVEGFGRNVGKNVGKNVGRKGQNRFSCRPASLTNKPG